MADGYGCVFSLTSIMAAGFLHEAAAYDNSFFTGAVDAVVVEDLHAGLRSTWREALFCSGEYAYHGTVCDAVYVLLRGECFDDCCLIEMFRKRAENQNAVDGIVFVTLSMVAISSSWVTSAGRRNFSYATPKVSQRFVAPLS